MIVLVFVFVKKVCISVAGKSNYLIEIIFQSSWCCVGRVVFGVCVLPCIIIVFEYKIFD